MKKLLFMLLVMVSVAGAQGVRYSTQVQDTTGRKVSSPVVRLCSEPATGLTCIPLAAGLFSDRALTQPLANPFTGDINGNVGFYVAPGRYHAQVSGNGIVSFDVPDIVLSDPSLPYAGFVSVVPSTAPANQFATGVSAAGVVLYAQPAFSNISGTLSLTTNVSGVLIQANGGTGVNSTAVFPSSGTIETGTGTTNTISKFTNGAAGVQGNSSLTDDGTTVSASENVLFSGTLGVTGVSTLGNVVMNGSNTGTGAALTIGGTSSTTGGISVFVGPSGGQNERLSVVPADGSSAATRVGALSVRLLSAGFLTGSQVASISSAGVLSLNTTTGTLPATIANDTAGGILFTNNAGGSFQFGNGGTIFLNVLGGGIRFSGATSGTTVLAATAVAGAGTLSLPPSVNDTLVAKTTTDTLTNKRVNPRIVILTTSTTLTPDGDNSDISQMQMTGVTGTLTIAAPTGTPVNGQKLIVKIIATNSQTYSFNATYHFSSTTIAPTTIGAGKTDYLGCIWNSTNTAWDVVAVDQGH